LGYFLGIIAESMGFEVYDSYTRVGMLISFATLLPHQYAIIDKA
jgi:hypothetical protein